VYPVPPRRCAALLLGAAALLGCGRAESATASASAGLVFVRRVGDSTELVRARIADSAERVLSRTPEREERWPYWSDAAARLLFQAALPGQPNDLFLWSPGSGEETALVRTPERDERWQRWSPRGDRVVYAFRGGDPPAGVALLRPSDGATQLLASSGPEDFFLRPHFSPDGRHLVAQRRGDDGFGSWLWLLEPGQEPRRLTREPDRFDLKGRFTRDGSRIVYSRRRRGSELHRIVSIDVTGGDPRVLAGRGGRDAHSAQPSPTRDEIAFVARQGKGYDLFLADLDGGNARALTRSPERNELAPQWSPDGERLVVTTTPSAAGVPQLVDPEGLVEAGVAVLDRDGRELFWAAGFMPDWMPPWP
jgi:Tol biopolymer transport system component